MATITKDQIIFLTSKQEGVGDRTIEEVFPQKLYLPLSANSFNQIAVQSVTLPYSIINVDDIRFTNAKYAIQASTGVTPPPLPVFGVMPTGTYFNAAFLNDYFHTIMDAMVPPLRVFNAVTNEYEYPIDIDTNFTLGRFIVRMDLTKAPVGTTDVSFWMYTDGSYNDGMGKLIGSTPEFPAGTPVGWIQCTLANPTFVYLCTQDPTLADVVASGIDVIADDIYCKSFASSFRSTDNKINSYSRILLRVPTSEELKIGGIVTWPSAGQLPLFVPLVSDEIASIKLRFISVETGQDIEFSEGKVSIVLIVRNTKVIG